MDKGNCGSFWDKDENNVMDRMDKMSYMFDGDNTNEEPCSDTTLVTLVTLVTDTMG